MQRRLSKEEVREVNKRLKPRGMKMCNSCWKVYERTKDNFRESLEYGKLRFYFLCKTCEHRRDVKRKKQAALDLDKYAKIIAANQKYKLNNKKSVLASNRKSYHKRKLEKILEKYAI